MSKTIIKSPDVHLIEVEGEEAPFSPAVSIDAPQRLVFVSGQVAISPDGELVGKGDIKAQTTQVLKNIEGILHSAGASWDDLVKTTVFLSHPSLCPGYLEARRAFGSGAFPSSTMVVAQPVFPQFLIEIEAVAAVSD